MPLAAPGAVTIAAMTSSGATLASSPPATSAPADPVDRDITARLRRTARTHRPVAARPAAAVPAWQLTPQDWRALRQRQSARFDGARVCDGVGVSAVVRLEELSCVLG